MSDKKARKQRSAIINVDAIGSYEVATGSNLRETLRREGVVIDGTCSDRGTCGRCVVRILGGEGGTVSGSEAGLLGQEQLAKGHRLACRVTVRGDLSISIDPGRMLELDRTGRWKEVWGSPLWRPDLLSLDGTGYGVSVDLGSTSLVAGLFLLEEASPRDIKACANPQLAWGEDILSRLDAAAKDPGAAEAQRESVWEAVGELVRSLSRRSGISSGRIGRMVVVGNSAVHHLSLGLSPASLLVPPYSPADRSALSMAVQDLPVPLPLGRGAVVHFPPLAGGYAGSDAMASILAAKAGSVKTGAVIDVGTNTEIAVWRGDSILVGSAPSGPAFEGGHVRQGMRAEEGAVFRAGMVDGRITYEVLGGGSPRGICGTGIVDLIATMLENGMLDRTGLVVEGSHPLVQGGAVSLGLDSGVALYGEDVAQVQKAKAAIASTFLVLLREMEMRAEDLEHVYLAGAFGSRLNLDSAFRIGLLPEIGAHRYTQAGNTALLGASMVLVSGKAGSELERLWRNTGQYSVAEDKEFEELFIENLYFAGQPS